MVLIELTGPIHAVAGGGGSGMGRAGGRTPSVVAGQDGNSIIQSRSIQTLFFLMITACSHQAMITNPSTH